MVQDKAKIVIDDLWIHGDHHVKSVIDELRQEDPSIPEWVIGEQTREQRAFLDDVRELRAAQGAAWSVCAVTLRRCRFQASRRSGCGGKRKKENLFISRCRAFVWLMRRRLR